MEDVFKQDSSWKLPRLPLETKMNVLLCISPWAPALSREKLFPAICQRVVGAILTFGYWCMPEVSARQLLWSLCTAGIDDESDAGDAGVTDSSEPRWASWVLNVAQLLRNNRCSDCWFLGKTLLPWMQTAQLPCFLFWQCFVGLPRVMCSRIGYDTGSNRNNCASRIIDPW